MESLGSLDDLLDFPSDDAGAEDKDGDLKPSIASSRVSGPDDPSCPLPGTEEEGAEEELEWLSNKDAFPPVETFVDIDLLTGQAGGIGIDKHQSPVSVLDNSTATITTVTNLMSSWGTLKAPHRARSKGRRRRDIPGEQLFWNQANIYNNNKDGDKTEVEATTMMTRTEIGRKCQHCGAEDTPQWRAGPLGPKTLCNACGVRYKSGRLVPEYRPASSPTFSSKLHSNLHRKIIEMRKQKHGMGMLVKPEEKGFPGISGEQPFSNQAQKYSKADRTKVETTKIVIVRKCQHCGAEKSLQWHEGPLGKKLLCNACGVRYKSEMIGGKCQHCRTEETLQWHTGPLGKKRLCNACGVRYKAEMIGGKCQHCGTEETSQWHAGPLGKKRMCNACGVRYKCEMIRGKCQHCGTEEASQWHSGPLGKKLCACGLRYSSEMMKKCQHCGTETTLQWLDDGPLGKKSMCTACYVRHKSEMIGRKCLHCGSENTLQCRKGPLGKRTLCNACGVRYKAEMIGRKCMHCGAENTPQWREGPFGKRTLCNACGIKYIRTGKLLPEYRPASIPTFSSELHSNVRRKVLEMQRQKHEIGIGGEAEMIERKFQHCGTGMTPQWQDGPLGRKTLCSACYDLYKSRMSGEKCQLCGAEEPLQWRAGKPPWKENSVIIVGKGTGKTIKLVTKYWLASNPTFLSKLHTD